MSGMPAGIEDFSEDDDDFIYDDFEDVPVHEEIEITQAKTVKSRAFGHGKKLEVLEKEVSLQSEDIKNYVIKRNVRQLQIALDDGFDVDTPLQSGWTALMHASNNGFPDILELLLKNKASPNVKSDLFTPVMAVCLSSSHKEEDLVICVKMLLEYGGKVNEHDRYLMTPLMYAAKQGFSKIVNMLCEHNADVNQQETRGWTALSFAAASGLSHVVRVLLEYKADVNLSSFDGQKPTDIAFSHGFTMLSELLEKFDGHHAEQFEDIPSGVSSLKGSVSSNYVKYGDLELFLHGLELGHIVPLMQEQHLELKDLLKITEEEMKEIGITQLGVRKKLANAIKDVHSNEWDMKSLSAENISKLSTLETAAIVANITKHMSYLRSSVVFVNKHLIAKKEELTADNTSLQTTLVDQCSEALKVSSTLHKDITVLNRDAVQMFPNICRKPPDLLEKSHSTHLPRMYASVGIFLACGLITGYAVYRSYK